MRDGLCPTRRMASPVRGPLVVVIGLLLAALICDAAPADSVAPGVMAAWGDNDYGQCDLPVGAESGLIRFAAGHRYSLALRSDGQLIAWGDNVYGQCDVPALPPGLSYTAVAVGQFHNLALRSDGQLVAWGDNYYGQCDVPAGLTGVTAIAGGCYHSLALLTPNTPPGQNVSVLVGGAYITFGEVTTLGNTTLTTSTTPPAGPAPSGFQFLETWYDISTTATWSGTVTITLPYNPAGLPEGMNEEDLRLYHWEGEPAGWKDVTVLPVDTESNRITAQVTSLSPFAIGYPIYQFHGFLPPLDGSHKSFKRGSTIPIKFRISDAAGNPVPEAAATLAIDYGESDAAPGDPEVVSSAPGDSGNEFRYDPADDLYIFNLSTKHDSFKANQSYDVVVTLDNGEMYTTTFGLK